jgi:hypothetical protein
MKGSIVIVEPDDLFRDLLQRWLAQAVYRIAVPAKEDRQGIGRPKLVIARPMQSRRCGGAVWAARSTRRSSSTLRDVLPKPFTR